MTVPITPDDDSGPPKAARDHQSRYIDGDGDEHDLSDWTTAPTGE
jgi:hypothetical protein